jgi:hypothetical protein
MLKKAYCRRRRRIARRLQADQLQGPRRSGAALRLQGGFEEAKRELMTAVDFAREPGWN